MLKMKLANTLTKIFIRVLVSEYVFYICQSF